MNPILNPFNSFPLLKTYFLDKDRLRKYSPEKIKKYRDNAFKKIVKYAYSVPLYNEKYKKAGIHPRDVKGIEDIVKLPMVSKNDMRENFPDRIIPVGCNKKKNYVVCTGGTTGKSISIYTDFLTMGKGGGPLLRELDRFNLTLKNARIAHIGNFNPCRIDLVAEEQFHKYIKFMSSIKRLNLDVNTPPIELIRRLDEFRPDFMISYPEIYQNLAFLKRKGQGKNVNPRVLYCAGSILDNYTKKYVEDAFGCPLLNSYQSVEAHSTIATECMEGTWHVNWDFYHLEAIDDNGELVAPGERGHLVMTRLFGKGTPMIRYTGMDDWVRIIPLKKCKCGLTTPALEGGVEGRKGANIVTPSGKTFPPGAFCFIEPVLTKHKSFKVKQYQVRQNKLDEIDILLVIDEELRNVGVSLDVIKREIKENYEKKVGPEVTINIKEVKEIKNDENPRKPASIVISKLKKEEVFKILERRM